MLQLYLFLNLNSFILHGRKEVMTWSTMSVLTINIFEISVDNPHKAMSQVIMIICVWFLWLITFMFCAYCEEKHIIYLINAIVPIFWMQGLDQLKYHFIPLGLNTLDKQMLSCLKYCDRRSYWMWVQLESKQCPNNLSLVRSQRHLYIKSFILCSKKIPCRTAKCKVFIPSF